MATPLRALVTIGRGDDGELDVHVDISCDDGKKCEEAGARVRKVMAAVRAKTHSVRKPRGRAVSTAGIVDTNTSEGVKSDVHARPQQQVVVTE